MELLFSDTILLASFQGLGSVIFIAIVVFIAPYFIKGISVDGPISALIASIAMAVISFFLNRILDTIVSPFGWITLGLVYLIVDAIIIYFAHMVIKGFRVRDFGAAFILALVITVFQMIF